MSISCGNCGKSLSLQHAGVPCPDCGGTDRNVAAVESAVASEKLEAARELARKHYLVEPRLANVFRVRATPDREIAAAEPIKLLEVNEDTVPAGIMPLHFGPAPAIGIPYSSVIIEVTPDEYAKILAHELSLPDGWEIAEELPKPNGTGGA